MAEPQLFGIGFNVMRTRLVTVPGAAVSLPFGGRQRQILIDLAPDAMQSKRLSAQDISNAIAAQVQITPAGLPSRIRRGC